MAHILHLDSSPRGDRSISRQLTKRFITSWTKAFPEDSITYRDLGHYPVPFIDENWIAASFASPEARTPELAAAIALSDQLVDEFLAADYYIFGIPMYNLSIPANFKAYIDQIVRINRTLAVKDTGNGLIYEGLVKHKKMVIVTARSDNYRSGTAYAYQDFQAPYLRAMFEVLGITDITFIHADNLAGGAEARQQSLANAHTEIQTFIAALKTQ
ncbi:MAG: NAD(P)H-dependent oxidoreductase [Elainella sp. C42_A2020_010]|nr:NAD(P)H-dependent oxidoreductase [Elainella sp. C42_A2020_010]RNJ70024.1 MAG: FMN-dependent NADH-azoreductase [Leptolyngbya sp. IPPAS B-1204]